MSRRPGAIYADSLSGDGTELEYEGHDVVKAGGIEPKQVDQPWQSPNGSQTENAKFAGAAESAGGGKGRAPKVRVYEKLRPGIWSDKGLFDLIDYRYAQSDNRKVFKFKMRLSAEPEEASVRRVVDEPQSRMIPSSVKQAVYKRDKGKCVLCEAKDHLHFDHDLPYSRGGASVLVENVRLLCARHNLQKSAKIE
jgi:hypothetical protein